MGAIFFHPVNSPVSRHISLLPPCTRSLLLCSSSASPWLMLSSEVTEVMEVLVDLVDIPPLWCKPANTCQSSQSLKDSEASDLVESEVTDLEVSEAMEATELEAMALEDLEDTEATDSEDSVATELDSEAIIKRFL